MHRIQILEGHGGTREGVGFHQCSPHHGVPALVPFLLGTVSVKASTARGRACVG